MRKKSKEYWVFVAWLTSQTSWLELFSEPSQSSLLARLYNESSRTSSLTSRAGSISSPTCIRPTDRRSFPQVRAWICPSPADSSAARRILTDRSLSAADGASMAAWWRWEYYCHWSLPLTDPPTRSADRPACRRRPHRRIFTGNTEQFTAHRSIAASLQEISCARTVRLRTGIRCMKSECTSTSTVSW